MIRKLAAASAVLLCACSTASEPTPAAARVIVERLFEAFNRHDVAAMRQLYAPDATHVSTAFCSPKRGPDEIAAIYAGLFETFPNVRDDVVEIVAEGDHAAVRFMAHGNAPERPFDREIAAFFEIRDGLIVREQTVYDVSGPCQG